jgi:hypothetical protein
MTVRGKDKAPEPKPVPEPAKTGSNIAIAAAKSTVVELPAVQNVAAAAATTKQ